MTQKYYVVQAADTTELMRQVNLGMEKRWIPQGSVSVAFNGINNRYSYCQAMIRTTPIGGEGL